jgi:NADPH:quinone reductase-like Zn-dependent oxidoreductase
MDSTRATAREAAASRLPEAVPAPLHPLRLPLALGVAALLCTGTALAQEPGAAGAAPRTRAIVHDRYGPPESLRLELIERCVPRDDQVLVKVRAAAVNPLDSYFARGTPYLVRTEAGLFAPKVTGLGVDLAGQVEAVGKDVTRFKPGDEVFGHRFGAFAEHVCAYERSLAPKPPNVSFEQAAGVAVAGVTALQALRDEGHLQPGQKVLVNGASGGVGTFAVQLAKAMGAQVTGVCSTRNVELVRSLGADRVVDYTREDFTKSGERYDLIVDLVGTHSLPDTRRALTRDGTLVLVGTTEKGRWLKVLVPMAEMAVYSRFVSQHMGGMMARVNRDDLATLGELMRAGKLTPVVDRRFTLGEVPAAIRYVEAGHARGKVVIAVADDGATTPAGATLAAPPPSTVGPALATVAGVALFVLAPVVLALALNRRFQRRNPGKRPYRWGYYFGLQSFLAGLALGLALESGAAVVACAVVYGVLAWSFARRRRWAWVTLTLLTFNPVAWIVNLVYLRRRWAEDAVFAPAP